MLSLCLAKWRLSLLSESLGEAVSGTGLVTVSQMRQVSVWYARGLSHTAVLLSGLVHRTGLWGVEGGSECAQEASQQREAQSTPRTKHGPAVTMTDVLWYAKHVARIAGQFKVDSGHTRAKGDYAARPCQRARMKQVSNPIWSPRFDAPRLIKTTPPLCGESGQCSLCKELLTSHEEEKSGDILHQIVVLTAAQSAYDPAEHDDGYGHSYETGSHPLEICKKKKKKKAQQKTPCMSGGVLSFSTLIHQIKKR